MGATTFETVGIGDSAAEAFAEARASALYEFGHGGYSGTIAEKDGFAEFNLPDGVTVDEAVKALHAAAYDDQRRPAWADRVGDRWAPFGAWERAAATYNDKWGRAVALRSGPREWTFCGWASC